MQQPRRSVNKYIIIKISSLMMCKISLKSGSPYLAQILGLSLILITVWCIFPTQLQFAVYFLVTISWSAPQCKLYSIHCSSYIMGHYKVIYCQLMKDLIKQILGWRKSLYPMQQNYSSISDLFMYILISI